MTVRLIGLLLTVAATARPELATTKSSARLRRETLAREEHYPINLCVKNKLKSLCVYQLKIYGWKQYLTNQAFPSELRLFSRNINCEGSLFIPGRTVIIFCRFRITWFNVNWTLLCKTVQLFGTMQVASSVYPSSLTHAHYHSPYLSQRTGISHK